MLLQGFSCEGKLEAEKMDDWKYALQ